MSHYGKKQGLNQGKSWKHRVTEHSLKPAASTFQMDFSECLNNPVTATGSTQKDVSGIFRHGRECLKQCNRRNPSDAWRQLMALQNTIQKTIAGKRCDRLVQELFSGQMGMGTQFLRFRTVLRTDKGGIAGKNLTSLSGKDVGKRSTDDLRNFNRSQQNIWQ
jgi:hypothetical protein